MLFALDDKQSLTDDLPKSIPDPLRLHEIIMMGKDMAQRSRIQCYQSRPVEETTNLEDSSVCVSEVS